jgi:hypothetical protein
MDLNEKMLPTLIVSGQEIEFPKIFFLSQYQVMDMVHKTSNSNCNTVSSERFRDVHLAEFLKIQYLVLFFSSCISMINNQPPVLSPSLYSSLMILFIFLIVTIFKRPSMMSASLNKWCNDSKLVLKFDKTNFIKFPTNNRTWY